MAKELEEESAIAAAKKAGVFGQYGKPGPFSSAPISDPGMVWRAQETQLKIELGNWGQQNPYPLAYPIIDNTPRGYYGGVWGGW